MTELLDLEAILTPDLCRLVAWQTNLLDGDLVATGSALLSFK